MNKNVRCRKMVKDYVIVRDHDENNMNQIVIDEEGNMAQFRFKLDNGINKKIYL